MNAGPLSEPPHEYTARDTPRDYCEHAKLPRVSSFGRTVVVTIGDPSSCRELGDGHLMKAQFDRISLSPHIFVMPIC